MFHLRLCFFIALYYFQMLTPTASNRQREGWRKTPQEVMVLIPGVIHNCIVRPWISIVYGFFSQLYSTLSAVNEQMGYEEVFSMHNPPRTDNLISEGFLFPSACNCEKHLWHLKVILAWIRSAQTNAYHRVAVPFAVSVNLLNMHQVMISNAPPVHVEVIKPNMINGWVLKQLNLKRRLSNKRSGSYGKEKMKVGLRLTVKREGH